MGKLLFIDSDDVDALSNALQEALQRRGINFNSYGISHEEDEEDIDPYLGIMPTPPSHVNHHYGGCGTGGCGYVTHYGGCGTGGCGSVPHYGGCGTGGC